ncbi:hypothetical protein K1719_025826 [Acacia pycnantha]|nr:hypothetical protein K1719_025826 [Acacia pycnantha]
MKDFPGTPGTLIGLVLRISLCIFVVGSSVSMATTSSFFNFMAFCKNASANPIEFKPMHWTNTYQGDSVSTDGILAFSVTIQLTRLSLAPLVPMQMVAPVSLSKVGDLILPPFGLWNISLLRQRGVHEDEEDRRLVGVLGNLLTFVHQDELLLLPLEL